VNWTMKLQDYDFQIQHISGEQNRRADALSQLEGIKKASAKVGVVLPERLFACFLSGDEIEEEPTLDRKSQEIALCHNVLTVGHSGVRWTLELLFCKGIRWTGIWQDVKEYVKGCIMCQKAKPASGQ
jgi:hypothetical protein